MMEKIDKFINKANIKHYSKYDYSKVEFINATTKVCIVCPEHGEFWQLPSAHLSGQGCPKCKGRNLSQDDIIEKFKSVHGDKYDYSKVLYAKMHDKVEIICPIHGSFFKTPSKHILGQGCPKCAIENRAQKQTLTNDEYIHKAKEVHGDKYDYSNTNYTQASNKINIICKRHGAFQQIAYDHLQGHGCPVCGMLQSHAEREIYDTLLQYFNEDEIIRNDRAILNGQEIDILIKSKNIGIEYNGLLWHSEYHGKDSKYHLRKTENALKNGIKLIQVFEDEWLSNKSLVIDKILHILNVQRNKKKIMARKCTIKEIDKSVAKVFLDKNHIQGNANNTVSIGCYYNDELIGVMSFKYNKDWELVRFASNNKFICQGIGGKLFKYFIKQYNPSTVKSFADRRWTINEENIYTKLGFKLDNTLKPDYRYISIKNPSKRIHKFNFRKQILNRKYKLPLSMTENEMTRQLEMSKIYDCGLFRYIWKK